MAFLGMDAIRKIGLQAFSELYRWPISDAEYRVFVDSILGQFEDILIAADPDITDIVIADYRFVMFIILHIHHNAASIRFGVKQPSAGADPSLMEFIYPSWQAHLDYLSPLSIHSGHFGNPRPTTKSQLGHRARRFLKSAKVNRSASLRHLLASSKQTPVHVSIGPFTLFKQEFLSGRNELVYVSEWDRFGTTPAKPDPTFERRIISGFVEPFIETLRQNAMSIGGSVDFPAISRTLLGRATILNGYYRHLLNTPRPPMSISLTAAGNPLRKILATALARLGTKSFVLHHGDCHGVERYPHAHRNDGSWCNFFVCPTSKITDNFRENYGASRLEQHYDTQYICSPASHYPSLRQRYRSHSEEKRHPFTVMLIGFGMNHVRYLDGAGYFYYFQLDLQYRVALLIKKLGYRLVYKIHPDRAQEVGSLFAPVADALEQRPFEETWNTADYYVFTHPGTTVFGQTVLTTKPMMLIDLESNNWNSRGYQLLNSRCHMVSSRFDCHNRIVFDEDQVAEKLANPLTLNDSYIDEFLF